MKKQLLDDNCSDFRDLLDCLAIYAEATARLEELENDMQQAFLDLVDARRRDYAGLQEALSKSAAAVEAAAVLHPEWFAKAKSVKTPYGTVGFRTTTKLEIPNEAVTLALLERDGRDAAPFVTTTVRLNLEALETMDDAELARLKIRRVKTESFRITPARVEMGKAVARAEAAAAADAPAAAKGKGGAAA
jgi:hypothetical protein